MRLYLDDPDIGEDEICNVTTALSTHDISTRVVHIDFVKQFEAKLSNVLNNAHVLAVNSGTSALRLAIKCLGLDKYNSLPVSSMTFKATYNALNLFGIKPILYPVDPETLCVDTASIPYPCLVVHPYGNPCDMSNVPANSIFIEDACEALGSYFNNKPCGAFSTIGCLSFNYNKIITCGSGGAVISHNKLLIDTCRYLASQNYDNLRMTSLNAAIGLAQINRLPYIIRRKRRINRIYKECLSDIPGISFQKQYTNSKSNFWFTVIITDYDLDNILSTFSSVRKLFPNSQNINGYCLPSSIKNKDEDIYKLCDLIRKRISLY